MNLRRQGLAKDRLRTQQQKAQEGGDQAHSGEPPGVEVKPKDITHVLYHARCDDGFGAAFSAWQVLGDRAQYIPVTHGDPPPPLPADAVVAMVDFSYKRPIVQELHSKLRGLIILDHHMTAQAELAGLDYVHFDMDMSGAHLSWGFFHPDEKLPDLLAYIEDKDLWRFKLPQSKEVTAALRSYPMDFNVWSKLTTDGLRKEGEGLLRFQNLQVEAACERARTARLLDWDVPIVNATDFRSEIANRLCELHPEAAFAAAYYDNEQGIRCWSLRSVGDFDVAEAAGRLGGGGHKNASGFVETTPSPAPPTK